MNDRRKEEKNCVKWKWKKDVAEERLINKGKGVEKRNGRG